LSSVHVCQICPETMVSTTTDWSLPLSVEAYAVCPPIFDMFLAFGAVFFALWVVEFALRPILGPVLARLLDIPFLRDEKECIKLARCIMSLLAMVWFTLDGWHVLQAQGGLTTILSHAPVVQGATGGLLGHSNIHVERVYSYIPSAQRLAVFHTAWEVKNLIDSLVHGDGALFVAHHIGTALVALGSLTPVYHPYVCYYLGWSEASSVVLPLCALLDDTPMGIPALGAKLPRFKKACGCAFAVLFVVFRIVLWSAAAYTYTLDGLAVIQSDACRSAAILRIYLSAIVVFTLLQFFFLVELLQRVYATMKGEVQQQEKKHS